MKKILLLTFTVLSTFATLSADWEYEYVGETSAEIKNISFGDKCIFFSSYKHLYKNHIGSNSTTKINDTLFNNNRIDAIFEYDDILLVATEKGLLRSIDSGISWEKLGTNKYLSLINSFGEVNNYLVVLSRNGVFRALKSDLTWHLVNEENNSYAENMTVSGNNILYHRSNTSRSDGGIVYSNNSGSQWNFREENVNDAALIGDTIVYISSSNNIFKSYDLGESWLKDTLEKRFKNVVLSKDRIYLVTYSNQIICYDYNLNEIGLKNIDIINNDQRIKINNMVFKNDSILIASSNGLYIYDLINGEFDLINPKVNISFFNTINKYKDSVLLTTTNHGSYIKHEDDDDWKKFDTSLYNLGYDFYNVQEIDNELYLFDPYMHQRKTVVLFKNENKQWDSLLLDNYRRDGFGRINDAYYYCDGKFVLYSDNMGKNWDILTAPKSKESDRLQSVYAITVFKNKLYIGANSGVYRYNMKNKNWEEIQEENNYFFTPIQELYKDDERLFAVGTSSGSVLFEYNKYEDVFETTMKDPVLNISSTNIKNLLWLSDTYIWSAWDSLYLTKDYGDTKLYINEELMSYPDDNYNLIGGYIYATTFSGLYKRSISDFGLTDVEVTESSELNLFSYPQPAKDELRIDVSGLTNQGFSIDDIKVYDYSGKEIAISNKLKIHRNNDGQSIFWDCSAEQAGVYIINITHGTEEKAVKVVIE